ncbi:MAG: glycosyltransferase family 39 protein [Opitutaceae bacterium]|nr:glycosyltransferase family 39 protein [Opitutaceae bacterium]
MTSTRRIDRHLFSLFAGLALLAYAAWVGAHTSPVAAGSDPAGYLLSAKLLTEGRLSTPLRTLPEFPPDDIFEYTPLGMIYSERLGALIPTYPIGLPLLYAAAAPVAGWTLGPVLVATLLACGAVLFTFLLVRELGVGRDLAALAAASLAVCPLVLVTTLQPMSDTASACCNAAAAWCALRARRTEGSRWGLAAGAALALTVLIRPSNLLMAPIVALFLGRTRLLVAAFLGGLPGAVFLGWYHHALYGSVLVTGYGSVWGMFGPEHVAPSLHKYLTWGPAFLPLAVPAVVLAPWWPWRTRARELAALVLWVVAYGGFYAFYPPTHEHRWYLRFIVPMFPALLALAALALEAVADRVRHSRRAPARVATVALLAGLCFAAAWHHSRAGRLAGMKDHAVVYREIPSWVDTTLPREAIVLTLYPSCSFYFYTDRAILRSDVLKPGRFAALDRAARDAGRPVYAIVARDDDERTLPQRLPGAWCEVRRFGDFGVWRLEPAAVP